MKRMLKIVGCAMLTSVMFFSCAEEDCPTCPVGDATDTTDTVDDTMPAAPTTYEFVDADGASTVSYSGQVVRNLIINDIKSQVTADPTMLTSMYSNDATNQARAIFTTTSPSSVQTTYGDISSKSVKEKISKLIDQENKIDPLGDSKIEKLLNEQGINIARRTVAKYREELNYPVARLRKELK